MSISEYDDRTICALATAVGGAVAILRISGPQALAVGQRVWRGRKALGGKADNRRLLLGSAVNEKGEVLDAQCLAVYMPGPNSYTGEDVVELQLHGGPLATRLVYQAVLQQDTRCAAPGEFTYRAFLNGRLDLTQAEAVVEHLNAGSEAALHLANGQLNGRLGNEVNSAAEEVQTILSEIESRLDFPEEELDWMTTEALQAALTQLQETLSSLSASRREGEILREGITLAIAGAPNVGKSSLLNRLLGRERAIVSEIPGTTRDTIEADLVIRGIPIHLIDTAGIRDATDRIEQDGIQRSRQSCADADVVIWLSDATQPNSPSAQWPGWDMRGALITAANKCDLAPAPANAIPISAATGAGMDQLSQAIENAVLGRPLGSTSASTIAVSARHAALLDSAVAALQESWPLLSAGEWELAAIPLRVALDSLWRITGRSVAPDILDTIFHRFCIGK